MFHQGVSYSVLPFTDILFIFFGVFFNKLTGYGIRAYKRMNCKSLDSLSLVLFHYCFNSEIFIVLNCSDKIFLHKALKANPRWAQ